MCRRQVHAGSQSGLTPVHSLVRRLDISGSRGERELLRFCIIALGLCSSLKHVDGSSVFTRAMKHVSKLSGNDLNLQRVHGTVFELFKHSIVHLHLVLELAREVILVPLLLLIAYHLKKPIMSEGANNLKHRYNNSGHLLCRRTLRVDIGHQDNRANTCSPLGAP